MFSAAPLVELVGVGEVPRNVPVPVQVSVTETPSGPTGHVADVIGNPSGEPITLPEDVSGQLENIFDARTLGSSLYVGGRGFAKIDLKTGEVSARVGLNHHSGIEERFRDSGLVNDIALVNGEINFAGVSDFTLLGRSYDVPPPNPFRSDESGKEGSIWNVDAVAAGVSFLDGLPYFGLPFPEYFIYYNYLESMSASGIYVGRDSENAFVGNGQIQHQLPSLPHQFNNNTGGALGISDDGAVIVGFQHEYADIGYGLPTAWVATDISTLTYRLQAVFEQPNIDGVIFGGLPFSFDHVINTPDYGALVIGDFGDYDTFDTGTGFWNALTGDWLGAFPIGSGGVTDVELVNGEVVIATGGGQVWSLNDTASVKIEDLVPSAYDGDALSIRAIFDTNGDVAGGGLGLVVEVDAFTPDAKFLVLTFDAAAPQDQAEATYQYAFDWNGDGTNDELLTGAAQLTVSHTFPTAGATTMGVVATNLATGLSSAPVSQAVIVKTSVVTARPEGASALVLGGSESRDTISFQPRYRTRVTGASGRLTTQYRPGFVVTTPRVVTPAGVQPATTEFIELPASVSIVEIYAAGGNDTVTLTGMPSAIRNHIFAGNGHDTVTGGPGRDEIDGGLGNDSLSGQAGNDTLRGGMGNDWLWGGSGQDILLGDEGDDTLQDSSGTNLLAGGAGRDRLTSHRADLVFSGIVLGLDVSLSKNVLAAFTTTGQTLDQRLQAVRNLVPRESLIDDAESDTLILSGITFGAAGTNDRPKSLIRRLLRPLYPAGG